MRSHLNYELFVVDAFCYELAMVTLTSFLGGQKRQGIHAEAYACFTARSLFCGDTLHWHIGEMAITGALDR